MTDEIENLIQRLIETDDDDEAFDADLGQEVELVDLEAWLISVGFREQGRTFDSTPGTWFKFMGDRAVTVSKIPNGYYTIGHYNRGPKGWLFSSRYEGGASSVISQLQDIAEQPYQESLEDDEEDLDPKDVYDVTRKSISHIQTQSDYAEYQERVSDFLSREGVRDLSSKQDQHGNTLTNEFSRTPCDVCRRPLAGSRVEATGYNPETREIHHYEICPDCEYYMAYGQLDDMTMMDLKDDPQDVQERYGGAKQERGIWYHGTSSALIPRILSQGLIPEPKRRSWSEDPDTSITQHTRRSLPGIYVTTNLMTAVASSGRVARRDKASYTVVVMELQPRSLVADEDSITFGLTAIASYASGSSYHHIWPYLMEVYGDHYKDTDDQHYRRATEKSKLEWVNNVSSYIFSKIDKPRENSVAPELEKRVKELLFNEGYRAMLERNVAYTEGWDVSHWKAQWSRGFGDYDTAPPIPDAKTAETKFLAFMDKLARAVKDIARPSKTTEWALESNGRLRTPVGFKGSNRIICIVEQISAREPDYHSRMIVHFGQPPEKLIKDWTASIGPLDKPDDIVYKNKVQESDDDDLDVSDVSLEPPPEPIFDVNSSHGQFTVQVDDGAVVSVQLNSPEDPEAQLLKNIVKFDVGEWRRYYDNEQIMAGYSVDILDLGFWLKDGAYEPADMKWRQDFAEERHKWKKPQEGN